MAACSAVYHCVEERLSAKIQQVVFTKQCIDRSVQMMISSFFSSLILIGIYFSVQTIGVPVLFASTLKPYDLGLEEHVFNIQLNDTNLVSRVVCSICESTRPSKVVSRTEAVYIGEGRSYVRNALC